MRNKGRTREMTVGSAGPLFLLCILTITDVTIQNVEGLCEFVGLIASCQMTLGGVPVRTYARVNHCHSPVDITFQVQGEAPSNLSWRYTYVTTNLQENAVLSPHIMLAMISKQDDGVGRMNIKARFLLDGGGGSELEFLNTDLILPPPQENCLPLVTGTSPGWIAGACLLGLGVATVVIAVAILKTRSGGGASRLPRGLRTRFQRTRPNTGGTVVQYVVPDVVPADLKVMVSTSTGLKPVSTKQTELRPQEVQLTVRDLTLGISNQGYWSEDEAEAGKTRPRESRNGGLEHLELVEETSANNNSMKTTELSETGAIPKRILES